MKNNVFKKKAIRVVAIVMIAVLSLGIVSSVLIGHDGKDHSHIKGQSNVIMVSDCDSMNGWKTVKIGGTFPNEINTQYKRGGLGSIGGTVTDAQYLYSTKVFLLNYEMSNPIDISDMTHFAFDMYVEDAAAFEGALFTAEIGSTLQIDVNEIQTRGLKFSGLKNGWNHIEIEISAMAAVGTEGMFDPTNTVRFRLYNGDGSGTYSGLLLFDNFYFTNAPVGEMVS